MAAITKERLLRAMATATEQVKNEMSDTQWGAVSETICKLMQRYTLTALKEGGEKSEGSE